MSKVQLTMPARRALLALLTLNMDDATNSALEEHCGVKIDLPTRTLLKKANLVTAERRGNPYYYALTTDGQEQAQRELAAVAPDRGTRLLFAIANALAKVMADCDLKAAEVFGTDPISGQARSKSSAAASAETRDLTDDEIEAEVLATYDRLARRRSDLVSLVKLRGNMPAISRQSLDRRRVIHLDPDSNRKALPPEAHEAALSIGGEDKHFISVGHR
jgi:hypothetical protein